MGQGVGQGGNAIDVEAGGWRVEGAIVMNSEAAQEALALPNIKLSNIWASKAMGGIKRYCGTSPSG